LSEGEGDKESSILTEKQRRWVIRRDGGRCQFIDYVSGSCTYRKDLHIHFIVPPRWAKYHPSEKQIISPLNLIVLCRYHHLKCLHPDVGRTAQGMYHYTPDSYKIEEQKREALAKAGTIYWYAHWDDTLRKITEARTRHYLWQHPDDPFP